MQACVCVCVLKIRLRLCCGGSAAHHICRVGVVHYGVCVLCIGISVEGLPQEGSSWGSFEEKKMHGG